MDEFDLIICPSLSIYLHITIEEEWVFKLTSNYTVTSSYHFSAFDFAKGTHQTDDNYFVNCNLQVQN